MKSLSNICVLFVLILIVGCKPQAETINPQLPAAPEGAAQPAIPTENTAAETTTQQAVNETVNAPTPPPSVKTALAPATPTGCSDSDAGSNTQKGSTMISFSDGTSQSESDSCASPIALSERSCQGSSSQRSAVFCSNGCSDGACQSGTASLRSFPQFFADVDTPNVKIVLGDSAPVQHVQAAVEIATSLTAAFGAQVESKLASEVPDPSSLSLLLIGNACDNPATAQLLGNPSPCSDDISGEGKIRIAKSDGKTYVFVTGSDSQDVRKAARLLARYQNYSLGGTTIRVGGDLANPTIIGST